MDWCSLSCPLFLIGINKVRLIHGLFLFPESRLSLLTGTPDGAVCAGEDSGAGSYKRCNQQIDRIREEPNRKPAAAARIQSATPRSARPPLVHLPGKR